jgi:hypothetical protein
MLADVSGEEVEAWLLEQKLVQPSDEKPLVPTNSACTDEEHDRMAAGLPPQQGTIKFIPPEDKSSA